MKELLLFAGTTEGRKLAEYLADLKIAHMVCVATEYGANVLKEHPFRRIFRKRMNQKEIRELIQRNSFLAVIDATHPYADEITKNIKIAVQETNIPYFRLKREGLKKDIYENVRYFDTHMACAKALEEISGNILLTTGSKDLAVYCAAEKVKSRLYVRILPSIESLSFCMEQGISGKQMIAMQGPFTMELNEAILYQYHISCLVTKESGISGGYSEKLEAAKRAGAFTFVIGHPEEKGYTFEEMCKVLESICGQKILKTALLEIVLAGIGMGSQNILTKEAEAAIGEADVLLGAERMLDFYRSKKETYPYYQAEQVIPFLKELQKKKGWIQKQKVVILFSGDSGFYSGCQALYQALQKEIQTKQLEAAVQIMPGISSVSYLAACIGESYQDVPVYSMHGKEVTNLVRKIKTTQKIYLLMSGVLDVMILGKMLIEANLTECEIVVGYQLSYAEQKIQILTPEECCTLEKEGLYICLVKNKTAQNRKLIHGISDEAFIRGRVPMTKEEIREISICKLGLYKGAVIYDIGSGTGSIAVEAAGISDEIQIYAVERNKEAIALIQKNMKKFFLQNVVLVEKEAPQGLKELPQATHALIGGSGGKLKEILSVLYQINPYMRVVIHAVSIETICKIKEILSQYSIEKEEILQVQVSHAKKIKDYHLIQAENPIWIFAFYFIPAGNKPSGCKEDIW